MNSSDNSSLEIILKYNLKMFSSFSEQMDLLYLMIVQTSSKFLMRLWGINKPTIFQYGILLFVHFKFIRYVCTDEKCSKYIFVLQKLKLNNLSNSIQIYVMILQVKCYVKSVTILSNSSCNLIKYAWKFKFCDLVNEIIPRQLLHSIKIIKN